MRIARHGDDADRLSIETGEIRGRETVRIVYPADQVVYPEMGRSSSTTQRVRDDGTFSDSGRGRGQQVRVRGSGRGLEAWADLVIEVTGSASGKRFIPYESAYESGFEDLMQRQPDLARIRDAIEFQPRIPLDETIRDLAAHIRDAAPGNQQ